jgi:hypothetical protein
MVMVCPPQGAGGAGSSDDDPASELPSMVGNDTELLGNVTIESCPQADVIMLAASAAHSQIRTISDRRLLKLAGP